MGGRWLGRRVWACVVAATWTMLAAGCACSASTSPPGSVAGLAVESTVSVAATGVAEPSVPVSGAAQSGGGPMTEPAPGARAPAAPGTGVAAVPDACKRAARDQPTAGWTVCAPAFVPEGFVLREATYSRGVVKLVWVRRDAVILFVEGQWTAPEAGHEYRGTVKWGSHAARIGDMPRLGWDVTGARADQPATVILYHGGELRADYALFGQRVSDADLREMAASMRVVE